MAPAEAILMDAKIESELAELPAEEAAELLAGIGQDEPGSTSSPASGSPPSACRPT